MLIRAATPADLPELVELAALTFPLAAPDDALPESIAAFVAENLSTERFTAHLADADRDVLVAVDDDVLVGYLMTVAGEPYDADAATAVTVRPVVELSKFYVTPAAHGGAVAQALMTACFEVAERRGAAGLWLGVNQENERAQRFYAKAGFERVGTKRFQVGDRLEHDYVLQRKLRQSR